MILNYIIWIVVLSIGWVFLRLLYLTICYQLVKARLRGVIPRKKSLFAILNYFDTTVGFDEYLKENFDENGVPIKVTLEGPRPNGTLVLGVSDPVIIKEVLTQHLKYPKYGYELFEYFFGQGLVVLAGERYKRDKRVLGRLFHNKSIKDMIPAFHKIAQEEMQSLRNLNGEPISADFLAVWTMRAILVVLFGNIFASTEDQKWMAKRYLTSVGSMPAFFIARCLVGDLCAYLPLPFNFNRWSVKKEIWNKFSEIATVRTKQLQQDSTTEGTDLITLCLLAKEPLTFSEMIDESFALIFAGLDSTSKLLQWTLYFLCKHPDVQSKMYEEIVSEGLEDLTKLKYCRSVLFETLRLRPPVPGLPRLVPEDTEINGVFFPKGAELLLLIHAVHLDPRHWEKPLEFIPERFGKDFDETSFLIPFAVGERQCLGTRLAIQEATVFVSNLVKEFKIESDTLNSVIPAAVVALTPLNLTVKFIPRNK